MDKSEHRRNGKHKRSSSHNKRPSSKKKRRRSTSEGGQPRDQSPGGLSRQSEASCSSREVRCACQFYQSDSLLPERTNPVGSRPESRTEWYTGSSIASLGDHEYEPIASPESERPPVPSGPPIVHITDTDLELHRISDSDLGSSTSLEKRYVRIPLDDEVVLPPDGIVEDAAMSGRHLGDTLDSISAQELQTQIEKRYFNESPDTTASRTDCEINTSQVDSSAIEDLPLERGSRSKAAIAKNESEYGHKLQDKLKNQAGKLKTKFKNMKRPTFKLPEKPHFERPKFSMPKIPDRTKINVPSFSLSRNRNGKKKSERQQPTETNVSPKKKIFDFSTYPRIFDKSKKSKDSTQSEANDASPEFSTVPRATRKRGPVGARWVHRFTDIKFADDDAKKAEYESGEEDEVREESIDRERDDSVERHIQEELRYEEEIDMDDNLRAYDRENREIHRASPFSHDYPDRWNRGSFHEHKIDDGVIDIPPSPEEEPGTPLTNQEEHSSGSSDDRRGRGVLEEINPDEFFLRQKGISQDDIEVGIYLSSEIRDAFSNPVNALSQMTSNDDEFYNREYDLDISEPSEQSLPQPEPPKRRQFRKAKKVKKTPYVSEEQIQYNGHEPEQPIDIEEPEIHPIQTDYKTFPPVRPKRTKKSADVFIPYQETIHIQDDSTTEQEEPLDDYNDKPSYPSQNVLGVAESYEEEINRSYEEDLNDFDRRTYENEQMKGKEQPGIILSNPDRDDHVLLETEETRNKIDNFLENIGMAPQPPKRKKSIKSLNLSEHDSITGEFNKENINNMNIPQQEVQVFRVEHEYIIPSSEEPPVTPKRRSRPESRSTSQADEDRTSHGAESIVSEEQLPVDEPLCVMDIRDAMGYAIIDKSKQRDPPLPPPKTLPRKKRSAKSQDKFSTVPRSEGPPVRPLRNYSTLGPSRPPRKRPSELNLTDEKENIDITQYIEIEDDDHTRLQSGEVINKMKGRPLPAPPRPPRKPRDGRPLQDITHESNTQLDQNEEKFDLDEIEVSTQTDPLPDDFVCEELVVESTDVIVEPTYKPQPGLQKPQERVFDRPTSPGATVIEKRSQTLTHTFRDERVSDRPVSPVAVVIEKRVRTPTPLNGEEIQACLIVQPVAEPVDITKYNVLSQNVDEVPVIRPVPEIPDHGDPTVEQNEDKVKEIVQTPEQITPIKPQRRKSIPKSQEPLPQQTEDQKQTTESELREPQQIAAPEPSQIQIIERIIERQIPISTTPGPDSEVEVLHAQRLQVSDLDVERLNVSELQAGKITVSDVDGVNLHVSELSSKSGNLVVSGLELPPGLIDEIVERLQPLSQPHSSTQIATQTDNGDAVPKDSEKTTDQTQSRSSIPAFFAQTSGNVQFVPYPVPYFPEHLQSAPPPSFFNLRSPPTQNSDDIPSEKPSTSTEESKKSKEKNIEEDIDEPSITELSSKLFDACSSKLKKIVKDILNEASSQVSTLTEGKLDLQVVLIILLILIAGLMLLGYGSSGKTVHHHHWEYFNPPTE